MEAQLEEAARIIDRNVPALTNIRPQAQQIWTALQTPIELAPRTWLVLEPSEVGLSPITGVNTIVTTTLALRATNQSGLPSGVLRGPTGVVIGPDPVAAAKVLSDFARENEQKPEVKGGLLDGRPIDTAQVKQLASLPSREQMLAELGAGLQSPMAAFLGALNGLLYMFAGALESLRQQRESA